MLKIIVPPTEFYDESTEIFETVDAVELELEHSLVSLSKWESKYEKPFLSGGAKTPEEIFGYIFEMILTPNPPANILQRLDQNCVDAVNGYIDSKQSATTFGLLPETKIKGETVTSELIYYWLVAFNIPFEVEHWHLNRLLALVRICNVKNSKPKKMSRREVAARNAEINAQRRAQLNTSG